MKRSSITIVGAGLVGSLLSIYLARRGYKVTIFERRADMRRAEVDRGRSINLALSTRGIRALEEVGLANILRQEALPMKGRMMHDLHGKLSFLAYGKEGQFINSISRSHLNMILMTAAENAGVSIQFQQRCVHFEPSRNTLTFESTQGKADHSYDYLIGTDGAFSAIRGGLQTSGRFNFSQEYIEHGYRELHIPPTPSGDFALEPGALHIWPRESFMLIALPNPDKSFTGTLFFPFEGNHSFDTIRTGREAEEFFKNVFPDATKLIPDLAQQWSNNPASSLVTMRCWPWSLGNNVLLVGDAAHAIVPFFGQGMNAGFEDCRVLNELLDQHHDDWASTIDAFEVSRKPDADAIAALALDNFVEMRDLVADEEFLLRKKIEARLHQLFPEQWIPLYTMVTFRSDIRYSEAYSIGQKQKRIMDGVMAKPGIRDTWESLDFASIVAQLS